MIVKILSRHRPSYASLVEYILREDKSGKLEPQIFTHNIRSDNRDEWPNEFKENESFRLHERSNSIYAYHEIISLSSKENNEEISREILDDLARQYIALRGNDGMYIGAVHRDMDHIHVHFISSGLQYRTGKAFRLSRSELQTLKVDLQKYHTDKYPELSQSICQHGTNKPYYSQKEYQAEQREQRSLQKSGIAETVQSCFSKASSQQEFLDLLRDSGLHHYERKGKAQGIVSPDGMKFRFSRLGIEPEQIKSLPEKSNIEKPIIKTEMNISNSTRTALLEYQKGGDIFYNARTESYFVLTHAGDQIPITKEGYEVIKETPLTILQFKLMDNQQKLEEVYDRKDALYKQLEQSETGMCTPQLRNEIDEVTRMEASLVAQSEELRLSLESEFISEKNNMLKDVNEEQISLNEIQEIRESKIEKQVDRKSELDSLKNEEISERQEALEASLDDKLLGSDRQIQIDIELDNLDVDEDIDESSFDDAEEMEAYNEIQDARDSQDDDRDIDDDIDSDDDLDMDDDDIGRD